MIILIRAVTFSFITLAVTFYAFYLALFEFDDGFVNPAICCVVANFIVWIHAAIVECRAPKSKPQVTFNKG